MSRFRGYEIEEGGEGWIFTDTGEPVATTWLSRPCGHCGKFNTPEGHDACLGTIPGAMNACCGHGVEAEAYIQFRDGTRISGAAVRRHCGLDEAGRQVMEPSSEGNLET